ncbi:MAG TPA: hypothetical protein VEX36_09640 [Thermoleophilaceae bacterium]|nr:hypothetical protein [Thermoleophilaceae bacterium]
MTDTGYGVVIYKVGSGGDQQMQACGTGTSCGTSDWVIWAEDRNPQPHSFRVELRNNVGAVIATDTVTVDVESAEWSVSLEANAASVAIPAEIQVEATANRAMSGTGYSVVIVDEDDARDMNGWCSGATCGASEWMTWADNPAPEPQRYRAEIRHNATGAVVASDEVMVDVLPFTFGASFEFSVENGLDKGTATATPSPYGTSYSILIRRLDGTQVCQVWINSYSSCMASVAVGRTYRATVENGSGHVAGQSSWWTLTPNGPQEEKADDLDLIALAALYASPSAICSHVLLYPGTHLGGSSVSDQYLACEAAVQQGKTALGVLRAIAAAGGGTAVLWYLHERITEETTTPDPSDDEDVDEPTPVPPPIAWPNTLQDDVDQLMAQNPQLTSRPTATTVLKTCQRYVLRAGRSTDDCLDLPIFASGDLDVPQPTQHDRESISVRPQWVQLNYGSPIGNPARGWYGGSPQCVPPHTGQHCHEYPFFTTKQGGPNATPLPRLKLVAASQNLAQGAFYGHFARECLSYVDNAPFLSIPMPKGSGIPTLRLCN